MKDALSRLWCEGWILASSLRQSFPLRQGFAGQVAGQVVGLVQRKKPPQGFPKTVPVGAEKMALLYAAYLEGKEKAQSDASGGIVGSYAAV